MSEQTCISLNLPRVLRVGFGNVVMTSRVIAVLSPESAPVKRMAAEAKAAGKALDATHGRKTRSVVVTDAGLCVLSALTAETLSNRLCGRIAQDDDGEAAEEGEGN